MPVDDGQMLARGGADALGAPLTAGGPGARFLAPAFTLLATRASEAGAFLLTGAGCIVAGGFVAAVARPLDLSLGSWAAAYLVLVAGVVQIALGGVQAAITRQRLSRRTLTAEFVSFNVGNALVIAGVVLAVPAIVDVGGAALIVALALFLGNARAARPGWTVRVYNLVLAIVLVSIPIGLVLSHLRG